jgi:hypothetical protein
MKKVIVCLTVCVLSGVVFARMPIANEDFKLLASDGASDDRFGQSVSISSDGTTAIVGARDDDDNGLESGSAYIYELVGGIWQETKLLASDGASGDWFGYTVSISSDGTTAIVGALLDDDNGTDSGSAYIYSLIGGIWQETKLLASDGAEYDEFGNSVAVSGDTIIVGAHRDDENSTNTGSVYIYQFDKSSWNETKLTASDGEGGDHFGTSVALIDSMIVVGAPNESNNNPGSAYIYKLVDDSWIETKLTASDEGINDSFGLCVGVSDSAVVVGARGDDDNGSNSGSVYIYQFDESDWIETKLTPYDGRTGDAFGASVAVSDVTVVVGASLNDDGGFASGSAYIYKLVDSSWIETKLLASDDDSHDHFGNSIAVSGETIVVGAYGDEDNGSDSGSAYIFYLEDTDGDGIPDTVDNCYLYNPDQADCNNNGFGDVCDIDDQTSYDCDQNSEPDECQPDCDGDGYIDPCEILYGGETDYNDNDIPDNCDLDCNENGYPDDWEIEFGLATDCNENGIPDECDLANGDQVPEGAVQWPVAEGGNGHWYLAVELDESTTESSMMAFADGLGASLASIASLEEDAFVRSVASSVTSSTALLGGYEKSEGEFIWLDGTDFDYTNWDSGQPDGVNSGEYVAYYEINNFDKWHDVSFNDSTITHFVIEFSDNDCNSNGLLDSCEIADDPSLDCNGNGTLDSCEDFDDCNYNEIPDSCDITDGTSNDVNMNGVPDECESDCNENGIPDDWEIKKGLALDCNENMLPDECDIADGTSTDVNSNDVPDECEDDCNGNGVPDSWDIKTDPAVIDCNGNGIPDSCDVAAGCVSDCNLNGVPDDCDIADGTSEDINLNDIPDECECIADITGDGTVNIDDLLELIGYFGSLGPIGDFNADNTVSIDDLLILISRWGECTNTDCEPPEGAVQWRVEDGGNGHWYLVVLGNYTWQQASDYANSVGGHLATLTSAEENNWVSLYTTDEDGIHPLVGGYQDLSSPDYAEPDGGWKWVTGEEWVFINWSAGEPSNSGGAEHWLQLYSTNPDHGWNDQTATLRYNFIIEWSN